MAITGKNQGCTDPLNCTCCEEEEVDITFATLRDVLHWHSRANFLFGASLACGVASLGMPGGSWEITFVLLAAWFGGAGWLARAKFHRMFRL